MLSLSTLRGHEKAWMLQAVIGDVPVEVYLEYNN